VGKREGKRPLLRPRRRWEDVAMDDREMGGMGSVNLVLDRDHWRALVNTVMNLRVPKNVGKFLSSGVADVFSRSIELCELVKELRMSACKLPSDLHPSGYYSRNFGCVPFTHELHTPPSPL
jgi:hypothetical protein